MAFTYYFSNVRDSDGNLVEDFADISFLSGASDNHSLIDEAFKESYTLDVFVKTDSAAQSLETYEFDIDFGIFDVASNVSAADKESYANALTSAQAALADLGVDASDAEIAAAQAAVDAANVNKIAAYREASVSNFWNDQVATGQYNDGSKLTVTGAMLDGVATNTGTQVSSVATKLFTVTDLTLNANDLYAIQSDTQNYSLGTSVKVNLEQTTVRNLNQDSDSSSLIKYATSGDTSNDIEFNTLDTLSQSAADAAVTAAAANVSDAADVVTAAQAVIDGGDDSATAAAALATAETSLATAVAAQESAIKDANNANVTAYTGGGFDGVTADVNLRELATVLGTQRETGSNEFSNLIRFGDTVDAVSYFTNVGNTSFLATDISISTDDPSIASISNTGDAGATTVHTFDDSELVHGGWTTVEFAEEAPVSTQVIDYSNVAGAAGESEFAISYKVTVGQSEDQAATVEGTSLNASVSDLFDLSSSQNAYNFTYSNAKTNTTNNVITYQGDLNYDGKVSMQDIAYLNAGAAAGNNASDVDADHSGTIDINDLAIIDTDWEQSIHDTDGTQFSNGTSQLDDFQYNNDVDATYSASNGGNDWTTLNLGTLAGSLNVELDLGSDSITTTTNGFSNSDFDIAAGMDLVSTILDTGNIS